MNFIVEKNETKPGEAELTITIQIADQKKYLDKAAKDLSEAKPIKGFRPGKATFEVVEKAYGGEAILNQAIEDLVQNSLFAAIKQKNLKMVGQPKIDILKQAYQNDFVYKAVFALLPSVKVGDVTKVKVKSVEVKIDDKEVDSGIESLRKMRATEALVKRAIKTGDLVELDFVTKVNNVPIEGGEAKGYKLVVGDGQMIAGFEDELIGLKSAEDKIFKLNFPKEYKKDLAGKEAEFTVKIKNVYERHLPELNDEFAKGFGQENIFSLKTILSDNIKLEKETEELRRQEVEMLKQLIELSEFGALPELLITNEQHRMEHELQDDLAKNGLSFDQYLQNIDKTVESLRQEMQPQAEIRVKTALMTRQLADDQKIEASVEEVKAEVEKLKIQYQNNSEIMKTLESLDYQDYLKTILSNQKVITWLKEQVLDSSQDHSCIHDHTHNHDHCEHNHN